MQIIEPLPLIQGDKVGIVAPGEYRSRLSEIRLGQQILETMGYDVVLGQHLFERLGYLAGSDEQRAADINNMWQSRSIRAILCWGEHWGAARLASHLDYSLMQEQPKIFIGCGNVTALHLAIWKNARVVSFHGPSFSSFYRSLITLHSFSEILTRVHYPYVIGANERFAVPPTGPVKLAFVKGRAAGRLVGGNLATVTATLGTPYQIETEGSILFLVASNSSPAWIERDLASLWLAGTLQAAAGVVIGECVNSDQTRPDTANAFELEEVIAEYLGRLNAPSLYGLRIGQGEEMVTLPIGGHAVLDTIDATLSVNPDD